MSQSPSIPAIEPLSDYTWNNIEKHVFAALDREPLSADASHQQALEEVQRWRNRQRWRIRAFAVSLGLIAVAAVAIILLVRSVPTENGHNSMARVETSADSVELTLDGSQVVVAPHSIVWHGTDNLGARLILERGTLTCDVRPQAADNRFRIHADDVLVEVVGTQFTVTRAQQTVSVAVQEGVVDVHRNDHRTRLEAGQTWPSSARTEPKPDTAKTVATKSARSSATRKKKTPSPMQRWAQAQQLEDSDPQAAIAVYTQLAKGKGRWAANGLLSLCTLHAARGHKAKARKCVDTYLQRFKNGENRADALLLRSTL